MAKGFLISGWRLRVLDVNAQPPGSAFPLQVAFFDAGTQVPATVYNDSACAVALGPVVRLDSAGYAPDNGLWGLVGKAYKAIVSRVLSEDTELPDSERLETLYSINGIGSEASGGSGGGPVVAVASVDGLRSILPSEDGAIVFLSGYYSLGDGGEGWFSWSASSAEEDDGGYSIRPNALSSGEQGRFLRVLQGGELDVRWWGAIPDGSVDCVAPLSRCKAHAGRIDLYAAPPRIVFAEGKSSYKLPGNIILGGADSRGKLHSWRIKSGAKFSGFSSLSIESPAIIEAVSPLDNAGMARVKIGPGAVHFVDLRWWGGDVDALYLAMASLAPGIPVYLDKSCGYQGVISFSPSSHQSYPGKIIIGEGLKLHAADGASVTFESFVNEGSPRQLFSRDSTGIFSFTEMDTVPAWAYGWGSGANAVGIAHAVDSAAESNAVLHLNSYGVDGNGNPTLVTSDANNSGTRVFVDGVLSIGVGGCISVWEVINGAETIFDCDPSNGLPLKVYSGEAKAVWFGLDGFAVSSAIAAVGSAANLSKAVDLCGKTHMISAGDPGIVCDAKWITIKSGKISCYADVPAVLAVYSSGVCIRDVDFYGSANIGALVSIKAPSASNEDVRIIDCAFSTGSSGYGLDVGDNYSGRTTKRVRVRRCDFTVRLEGSHPFRVATNLAEGVSFESCTFSGLQRGTWELYGTGVRISDCEFSTSSVSASLLAWRGADGFSFTGNRCGKMGLRLLAFKNVDVVGNVFADQGVITLECQYNGQLLEGVCVDRNRFALSSVEEWPNPIFVSQNFTTDANGYITAVVAAFDWRLDKAAIRISGNMANMGARMHQTETSGRRFTSFSGNTAIKGLIPLAPIVHAIFSEYSKVSGSLEVYFPDDYSAQFDATLDCVKPVYVADRMGVVWVHANKLFSWSVKQSTYESSLNRLQYFF